MHASKRCQVWPKNKEEKKKEKIIIIKERSRSKNRLRRRCASVGRPARSCSGVETLVTGHQVEIDLLWGDYENEKTGTVGTSNTVRLQRSRVLRRKNQQDYTVRRLQAEASTVQRWQDSGGSGFRRTWKHGALRPAWTRVSGQFTA